MRPNRQAGQDNDQVNVTVACHPYARPVAAFPHPGVGAPGQRGTDPLDHRPGQAHLSFIWLAQPDNLDRATRQPQGNIISRRALLQGRPIPELLQHPVSKRRITLISRKQAHHVPPSYRRQDTFLRHLPFGNNAFSTRSGQV
jgi:hypothetical protein